MLLFYDKIKSIKTILTKVSCVKNKKMIIYMEKNIDQNRSNVGVYEDLPVIGIAGPCNSNKYFNNRNKDNTKKLEGIIKKNTAMIIIKSHGTTTYSCNDNYFKVPENVNLITTIFHGFYLVSHSTSRLLTSYGYTNYDSMQSMKVLIYEYLKYFDKSSKDYNEISPSSIRHKASIIFNARLVKLFKILFDYMISEIEIKIGTKFDNEKILSPYGLKLFNSLNKLEKEQGFQELINYTCSRCSDKEEIKTNKINYILQLKKTLQNLGYSNELIDENGNIANFETVIEEKHKFEIKNKIHYMPYYQRKNIHQDLNSNCICDLFPVNNDLDMITMYNNLNAISQYCNDNNINIDRVNTKIKLIINNVIDTFKDLFSTNKIYTASGLPIDLGNLVQIMLAADIHYQAVSPINNYACYYYFHSCVYIYELSIENMAINHGFKISAELEKHIKQYAIYLQTLCKETDVHYVKTQEEFLNGNKKPFVGYFEDSAYDHSINSFNNATDFERLIMRTLYLDVYKPGSMCPQLYLNFSPLLGSMYAKCGVFKLNLNLPNNITNEKKKYFPSYSSNGINTITVNDANGNQMGYVKTVNGKEESFGLVNFGCNTESQNILRNYGKKYFYSPPYPPNIDKLINMNKYTNASFYSGSYLLNINSYNSGKFQNFFDFCLDNIKQTNNFNLFPNSSITSGNLPVLSCHMDVPYITLEHLVENLKNKDFLDLYNERQNEKYIIVSCCKNSSFLDNFNNTNLVDFINIELKNMVVRYGYPTKTIPEQNYTDVIPRYPVARLILPVDKQYPIQTQIAMDETRYNKSGGGHDNTFIVSDINKWHNLLIALENYNKIKLENFEINGNKYEHYGNSNKLYANDDMLNKYVINGKNGLSISINSDIIIGIGDKSTNYIKDVNDNYTSEDIKKNMVDPYGIFEVETTKHVETNIVDKPIQKYTELKKIPVKNEIRESLLRGGNNANGKHHDKYYDKYMKYKSKYIALKKKIKK